MVMQAQKRRVELRFQGGNSQTYGFLVASKAVRYRSHTRSLETIDFLAAAVQVAAHPSHEICIVGFHGFESLSISLLRIVF